MKFVDNYGHIFTMPSYNQFPFGYEYEETDYIFWINKDYQNYLSINNYYSKVINILVPVIENKNFDESYEIQLKIDSNNFSLLSSNEIYQKCQNLSDINDYIELTDTSKKELTKEDLFCIKINEDNKSYYLIPLYIIGTSKEEGSWYTNVLISLTNKETSETEYTYFTIGGEFIDEYEQLVINGKNMGVSLPKDIIRAVYQGSYYNSEFNTDLYNQKLKEYLLNYMGIRGELGNFKSLENSVEWFGWGNNISISKLLQTDNQFKTQFVRDYFNINNDILDSFYLFRNSTYISLTVNLYKETGNFNDYSLVNNDGTLIWDEGFPEKESLLNKQIKYTENNGIEYIKGYFDYNFIELGLKLACFKLFLKQYFLPIHLNISSMSLNERVYTNDIKVDCYDKSININYPIIESYDKIKSNVYFNKDNSFYLQRLTGLVDNNFNDFNISNKNESDFDFYQIKNEIGIQIPIYFNNDEDKNDKIYNCSLLLSKEGNKNINGYYIDINYLININDSIEIYDYNLNKLNNDDLNVCYSYDSKIYSPYYKGVNKLFDIIKNMNKYTCSFRFNYDKYIYDDNDFITTTTSTSSTTSSTTASPLGTSSTTSNPSNITSTTTSQSSTTSTTNTTSSSTATKTPVNIRSLRMGARSVEIKELNKYHKVASITFIEEDGDNKIKYLSIPIVDILDENQIYYKYSDKIIYIDSAAKKYIKTVIEQNFDYKNGEYYSKINKENTESALYIDIKDYIELPIITNFFIRIKYNTDKIGIVKINSLHLNEYLPYYTNIYFLSEDGDNKKIDNKFYWLNTGSFFMHETGKSIFVLEESKHYENFNENLVSIKFLPTNTLIFESSFIFYENELYIKDNKKYFNFIICPKYIVNSVDESMWINNEFRIDLLVNGVWYNYKFNTKIAEPDITMGKLQYVYNTENSNYIKTTYFSQLSRLDDNIVFNTYSNINNLSLIEHNNFYEDYIKYYSNSNLKYLDGTKFIKENFYYSICYNNTYIYIDEYTKAQDFFIYSPSNKIESDKYNYCYLTAVNDNNSVYTKDVLQFNNVNDDIYEIEKVSNQDDYITFNLDRNNNKYYINNDDLTYTYYYDIISNINYNLDNTFLEKYKQEYNIVNNKKYYNNIILFDIYKEEYKYSDKYILTNNSSNIYYSDDTKVGKFLFNNYKFEKDRIISYINYTSFGGNTYLDTVSEDNISYIEDNIYLKNSISGLYSYNDTYIGNFYRIEETNEKDTAFSLAYNSYNITDIFAVNADEYTYGSYNINYNESDKTYTYSYSYYKVLECNYSYNCIMFTANSLIDFIDDIQTKYRDKENLLFNENNHYILISSYNSADSSIKDKFYIAYINSLGINYIENRLKRNKLFNNRPKNAEKGILDTFISYDYLDIQNLYFEPEFYYRNNGLTEQIYNPNYKELYGLYNDYYSNEQKDNYTYFIKYKFTKNLYNKYPNNFAIDAEDKLDNKIYNDEILKYTYNNSYFISTNISNNQHVNNFYIKNINLLDYFDDNELDSGNSTIRFKFNLYKDDNNTLTKLTRSSLTYMHVSILSDENNNSYIYYFNDKKQKIEFNIQHTNNDYIELNIKRELIRTSSTSTFVPLHKENVIMNISFNVYNGDTTTGNYVLEPIIQTKNKVLTKFKYNIDDSANNKYSFYLGGNNYMFDDNSSKIDLYKKFFTQTVKEDLLNKVNKNDIIVVEEKESIKINKYDFYLMHDFDYWYGIYISKDTIDKFNFTELNREYDDKYIIDENNNIDCILKYYSSSQQMLPNRMKLVECNGNNIFDTDDIIVIQNKNGNLPINIFNRCKWEANPLSLKVSDYKNESNSDMFIMSINNSASNYYKGYYDIILRYNIENYSQQQFLKTTKLLIK